MKLCLFMIIAFIGIELSAAKSYYISSQKENWFIAMGACHFKGYKLASIETQSDFDNLWYKIGNSGEKFWTSGTRLGQAYAGYSDSSKTFYWMESGRYFSYANWAYGQPDNHNGNQACVIVDGANGLKFDDAGCLDNEFRYICEY
ncbi:C-type lectin 37Da-like [Contarinia nasturtii]|uniref:C-type lectin 37Da-like n=1 Tax=Contarinia nasturtii TaxID=265458 RepID=UPI0012D487D7|nr:C-type lectin 37Da-like [Contarinia nasturtii]XP_031633135.1 C-type lectin 37Da-like [Contarinia nasturtii]